MNISQLLKSAGIDSPLRRTLHPTVRVLDEKRGICEYVASDETLDCYEEIVSARGWLFDLFAKNAPFVDSHDYETIARQLGKVVSWRIEGGQLVEAVQWAINLGNPLADLGWKMTVGGFLKAVSVGFIPVEFTSRWRDAEKHAQTCAEMKLSPEVAAKVGTIYLQQQQLELSACVIGANPNALARAYKAGCLSEEDLNRFSDIVTNANNAPPALTRAAAGDAKRRARLALMLEIQTHL